VEDGKWRQVGRVAEGDPDRTVETHVAYGGGVLALGSNGYDENGIDLPGKVYLYKRGGADHRLHRIARLGASDGFRGDRFGKSLAIENGVLVIGAPPAAYVFSRYNLQWAQRQKLIGSPVGTGDTSFGVSVAIRDRRILVGAPTADLPHGADDDITSPEGVGYVFLPSGGRWSESQVLNDDGQSFLMFANRVAMGRGMVAALIPTMSPFLTGTQGGVAVFDWVGEELLHRRAATTIPQGWFATDVDFSGRRLAVGMNESLNLFINSIGRVDIVEYAENP
jgi:hypothetical protein